MRPTQIIFALALAGMSVAPAAARLAPEAQLAKILKGRTAGPPVDCLQLVQIRNTRVIPRIGIVYETRNGRLYVNRPPAGASLLTGNETLVTDTRTSQLCNVDIVRLLDQGTLFPRGSIGLGMFVPYDRPGR